MPKKFYGPVLIKDFEFVKEVLRAHEGFELKSYQHGDKTPTIGNGLNLNRGDAEDILKACGIPIFSTNSATYKDAISGRVINITVTN